MTDPTETIDLPSPDPFHPDNVAAVQLIMLMRIYDVLMGLYKEQNAVGAKKIFQYHEAGKIAGPLPWFSGGDEEPV